VVWFHAGTTGAVLNILFSNADKARGRRLCSAGQGEALAGAKAAHNLPAGSRRLSGRRTAIIRQGTVCEGSTLARTKHL